VLLAVLREHRVATILTHDLEKTTTAAEGSSIRLMILHGEHEFCLPFLEFYREVHRKQTFPPLLIVATRSSEAFAISSLRAGAADYLTEPLDPTTCIESVSRWLPDWSPPPETTPLTGGEIMVGASPVMQALRTQIRRVAATDCNVLITGETGTGKELVAKLIHQNSARSGQPLISINCAAIPDSLLESELFGYERGAFTGASLTSPGKLMAADRGTVFFDEIGDMSPIAQAKILRAIETKEVQRLGATRRYDTDIRILAATHHDLDDLATAETFRRDLYFRLSVGRIYLPPLRERKADIPTLVERMVSDLNQRLGRRIEGITPAGIRCLTQHDWPGNVRELKNVIERVFISVEHGRIDADDLSRVLPQRHPPVRAPSRTDELHCLEETLSMCKGNKSKTAERLNCSRMTLYRKMAKYGLSHGA
jgi:DNA-binding NtrC family response regulator